MEGEGIIFRITHLEADVKELQDNDKEYSKNVTLIEKSNIRTEENIKLILGTYNVIKNAVLGFLALNAVGILVTFWIKK
jgi:hypothetical protein